MMNMVFSWVIIVSVQGTTAVRPKAASFPPSSYLHISWQYCSWVLVS